VVAQLGVDGVERKQSPAQNGNQASWRTHSSSLCKLGRGGSGAGSDGGSPVATPSAGCAESEAQIVQDNQLLQAVNAAISPDEVSPIDEYKISERPHLHAKAHPKMRMK
jgi:hypothetical protein